jgi:3',5'-cyclic AMP phosphodiesterase CpdA
VGARCDRQRREQRRLLFRPIVRFALGLSGSAESDAKGTLRKAIAAVNSLEERPDFIVFTGDLTHTTDDPKERRRRLTEFRDIVSALQVRDIHFMPGEHDASLDNGEAFKEFFGPTRYTFDHKGVHFIALDNVSDPRAQLVTSSCNGSPRT